MIKGKALTDKTLRRTRRMAALPKPFSYFQTPSIIHLYCFGNRSSPRLSVVRFGEMLHAVEGVMWDETEGREDNPASILQPPPYSNWLSRNPRPGISTFSAPVHTRGSLWQLTLGSTPEGVLVVNDNQFYERSHPTVFVDYYAWLPAKRMTLVQFTQLMNNNQKLLSLVPTSTPNTWVRLPQDAIPPEDILDQVPKWMAPIHKDIAQTVYNKITALKLRAVQLDCESDESLYIDEQLLVFMQYYKTFLQQCASMVRFRKYGATPILPGVYFPSKPKPGESVRFYSTEARVLHIPIPPVIAKVLHERIKELRSTGEDEDAMLDNDHLARQLQDVVAQGFIGFF